MTLLIINNFVPQDGAPIAVENHVTYYHKDLDSGNSTSWRTDCIVKLLPEDLGPGTHNFMVHMYPDIRDGRLYGGPTHLDVLPITLCE